MLDHQVNIKRALGHRPQGADELRAKRDDGDEMAVHHIDVYVVCPAFRKLAGGVGESAKIGG